MVYWYHILLCSCGIRTIIVVIAVVAVVMPMLFYYPIGTINGSTYAVGFKHLPQLQSLPQQQQHRFIMSLRFRWICTKTRHIIWMPPYETMNENHLYYWILLLLLLLLVVVMLQHNPSNIHVRRNVNWISYMIPKFLGIMSYALLLLWIHIMMPVKIIFIIITQHHIL